MKASEFLRIARDKISNDPRLRLSKKTKSAIDNPECIFDIHAHIFDKKCLTVAYILLRLLKSKIFESIGLEAFEEDSLINKNETEIYSEIDLIKTSTENDWVKLENEIINLNEIIDDVELFGFDLKGAFRVLKKQSMLEVLDHYTENFSLHKLPDFQDKPFVTGILMMDLETGWGIKPETKLYQQINEVKQILPDRPIIPFFPVDPRRADYSESNENLYELFLDAFTDDETPLFGVKCYPSLGYLPSDLRLDPIFQICSEKNIPVLTHCGGEIVSTFKKSFEFHDSSGIVEFTIPGDSRAERAKYLNNPELWIPVLKKYDNLKLNFGHFGGDTNWENHGLTGNNERIIKILKMMKNPDWKVFADFSFNVVEKDLFDALEKELDNSPEISNKTMFGTDYWVVLPAGDLLEMQVEFLAQMKRHQKNLLNLAPLNYLIS